MNFEVEEMYFSVFGFNFTFFDVGLAASLITVLPFSYRRLREEQGVNKLVVTLIFLHFIYQLLVIVPLSLQEKQYSLNNVIRLLSPRLYLLFVPFIYWHVLPAYKRLGLTLNWFYLSAIVLLIAGVYNYSAGRTFMTNTGEIRILWGGAALLYGLVLALNFQFVEPEKNRALLFVVAVIGLIFANHRTGYLAAGFTMFVSFFLWRKQQVRSRALLVTSLIVLGAAVVVWQVPFLSETFFSRVATATDIGDQNAQDRFTRWFLSASYFLDHPINGSMLAYQYYDDIFLNDYPPHNVIFETLSTQGAVGLIVYFLIFGFTGKIVLRNKTDLMSAQMGLALCFYLAFCLANTNFLNNWNILLLTFPSAIILYRNKLLGANESTLVH